MTTKLYTLLGFAAWQGIKLVVRRKAGQNKAKLGAAATLLLVLAGGVAISRATSSDDA